MQDIHERVDKLLNLNQYKARISKNRKKISKTFLVVMIVFSLIFTVIPITLNNNNFVKAEGFGYEGSGTISPGLDMQHMYRATMGTPSDNGTLDNISIYIESGWGAGEHMMLIIYNSSGVFVDNTTDLTDGCGDDTWVTFDVVNGSRIYANENYYIGGVSSTVIRCGYDTEDQANGNGGHYREDSLYSNWPLNPIDLIWNQGQTTSSVYIYANYTVSNPWSNTAPVISNPSPNATSGTKPYEVCRLNVTLNDINGNNQTMNVTFRSNHSGAWQDLQTNSSIPNGTYRCLNTSWITAENTKYYWSANVSDGTDWTNETYSFTTGAEEPGYTSYYVSKTGSDSSNGRSPYNRTGTPDGPWHTVDYAWGQLDQGERLYILEGTYTEEVNKYDLSIHGNITHPIIIEPYNNQYVILRQITDETAKGIITFYNQNNITLRNLHFNDSAGQGVFIAWNDPQQCSNITITGCYFNNCSSAAIQEAGLGCQAHGIYINDTWIYDCQNYWYSEAKNETISIAGSYDWHISNVTILNCPKWGIDIKSGSHHIFADNVTINNSHTCGHLPADVGGENRHQRGGGVYIDGYMSNCHNISLENFIIYGNKTGLQIGIEKNTGDYIADVDISNFLFNLTYDDIANPCIMLGYNEQSNNHLLKNINLKQITANGGYYGFDSEFHGDNIENLNLSNIIFSNNQMGFNRDHANFTPDMWNCLNDSAGIFEYYGENFINGSANFVSLGTNFNLSDGSDAIDTGIDTGLTKDIVGFTRPYNAVYDIGAYESKIVPWSNSNPVNSNPDPQNGNTTALTPTLRISVNDINMANQSVNTTWFSNSSGAWVEFGSNSSGSNTTFRQEFTNGTSYETTYWWSVNTSDGHGGWDNDTYSFTTQAEPPISDPGTNYYVSNSGSNANNGTHITTPWQTIAKVNSELNGGIISNGDNIYFKRGDTFTDSGLVPRVGGTSSNPMVFGAYGSGNKPIFSGNTNSIYYCFHVDHMIFQDIQIQSTSSSGLVFEGSGTSNITFRRMTTIGESWTLKYIDRYKVENCTFDEGALAIQGTTSDRIRNGIVRNCTFIGPAGDGVTLHRTGDGYTQLIGSNHLIENCTGYGYTSNEQPFDITSGNNIYIKNCTGYNSGGGSISIAHGVTNVTVENYHGNGSNGGIVFVWSNNTIIRNSVITQFTGRGLYPGCSNGDSYLTENLFVYNNDIIWYNGDNDFVQGDEDIDTMYFRNNIFLSMNSGSPTLFVDIGNAESQTYEGVNSNWTNNIWWRQDDLTGSHWQDSSGTYSWSQWVAKSVTSGEIKDDPNLVDALNDDFNLSSGSPCIDAGAWLTQTNGGGTGATITVDEANWFFAGLTGLAGNESVDGDNIFVGNDTNLMVTDVNYRTETITVNRSITWADGETVSLSSYSGPAPDIGAFELTYTGNTAPTNSNPSPSSGATGQSLNPTLQITVNDFDGNTMNQTFRTNATGTWLSIGWNNNTGNATVSNSTTVFDSWNTKYWWASNLTDGSNWDNDTYYFTTNVNSSPTLSSEEPSNESSNIAKQPRCNITVNDQDGDTMDISFASNYSGSWVIYQTNSSQPNGTYRWDFTGASNNHTTYWWRVYVNDSNTNVSETYHFNTPNNPPTVSNVLPTNGSTNNIQLPTVSLSANDLEGDTLTVYFYDNTSGSLILQQTNSSVVANSTVEWIFDNANGSNDEYWWFVNITDGIDWINTSYHFTTSPRVFNIMYVDNFIKYSDNPILERTIGDWDNYGIRDIGILVNETGYLRKMNNSYQMLYVGRNYSGANPSTSIGRAYSSNLLTNLTKYINNPIILNDTAILPTLRYAQGCNYIEYSTGEQRSYYATQSGNLSLSNSTDGINWNDQGTVYDPSTNTTNPDNLNCPHVTFISGMHYCVYEAVKDDGNFSIFMLNSTDGFTWQECNGGNPVLLASQDWDTSNTKSEVANPKLYKINKSMFVILYNGRNATNYWDLGIALSRDVDGEYTEWENNPILTNGNPGQWDDVRVEGPTIVMDDIGKHTLRMWYFGLPYASSFREGAIGYATCDDPYYTYPWQENPKPSNESIDVSINPQLEIDIYDNQGDAFNVYFYTNASGIWGEIGSSNIGATNGTFIENPLNMTNRSTIYWWSVNITDGSGFWDNETYHFTTLPGPADTPPNITGENPANGTIDVSLGPVCNVTVTHPDGVNSTVYFYDNSSGSFVLRHTEVDVLNESVSFTFSNADETATKYYWRVVGFDGSNYTNETYHFTTGDNDAPLLSAESPTNGSTGRSLNPTLSITIADNDSDLMYVTWRTNASGSWSDIEQDDDVLNSTQTCSVSNMGSYSTKYWWSANVSDFYGNWNNETYSFTTRGAPSNATVTGGGGGAPLPSSAYYYMMWKKDGKQQLIVVVTGTKLEFRTGYEAIVVGCLKDL